MLTRTTVFRAMNPYTRFTKRIAPNMQGPSLGRYTKVAKLWWATEPQFGRKYSEERALAALKLDRNGLAKSTKAKRVSVKPKTVAPSPAVVHAPKKARVAKKVKKAVVAKPDAAVPATPKVKRIRKVKKVKKAASSKPAAVQPVAAKRPKRKAAPKAKPAPKKTRKAPKKLTFKVFRSRVIKAAPKDARVSEKLLKDLYTATRLIRVNTRRIAYSKDGVRLSVVPRKAKGTKAAARKSRRGRKQVKKAAAAPVAAPAL